MKQFEIVEREIWTQFRSLMKPYSAIAPLEIDIGGHAKQLNDILPDVEREVSDAKKYSNVPKKKRSEAREHMLPLRKLYSDHSQKMRIVFGHTARCYNYPTNPEVPSLKTMNSLVKTMSGQFELVSNALRDIERRKVAPKEQAYRHILPGMI